ncbi:MAG TPA: hypothetical protein VNO81_10975 [Candidatus Nitrosotenuis sp.]|jgi:hypothetical protein|nr:hypothetical protein [Candidatus Nitrosotenuis sp.]
MRLQLYLLLGMALWVPLLGAWASDDPEGPPPTKLKDVRVWYYPPQGRPLLLKWWVPSPEAQYGRLKVDRRGQFSRKGRFRVRVETTGGPLVAGHRISYVSIVFRDENSNMFDLPMEKRKVVDGVKDLFWKVPYNFVQGTVEVHVATWNRDPAISSLLTEVTDRTNFLILGTYRL